MGALCDPSGFRITEFKARGIYGPSFKIFIKYLSTPAICNNIHAFHTGNESLDPSNLGTGLFGMCINIFCGAGVIGGGGGSLGLVCGPALLGSGVAI